MRNFKFFCILFLTSSWAWAANNTVTLNADLTSGNGSVSPTLTWSTSPVADSCTASGGWTGVKAASGSEKIAAITSSKTFVLSCSWGTTTNVISWAAPTKNTDGSNLTDLAGFKIYRAVGALSESLLTTINSPTTLTFSDGPVSVGTYAYTITAFNSGSIESDHTAAAVKVVTATTNTQQIAITVNPKPNAPTGVTVN